MKILTNEQIEELILHPPFEPNLHSMAQHFAQAQLDQDKAEMEELRGKFLLFLTTDSETKDARRKDFNQAIFDPEEGWAIFNNTDLDMVMLKFDKALKAEDSHE